MRRSSTLRTWAWIAVACWRCAAFSPLARAGGGTNQFVHPGLLQTQQDLDFMKRKVAAGAEPWKTAWENLLREPYSSLDFEPRGIAHVIRGPYGRPSVGDRDLMNSAKGAYSQALQWCVTGDKAHAQKAIAILEAWSAVLADFHDNDAKLLAGWTGHDFCNAAEILRCTGAEWDLKDLEQFKRMLLTVYYPLIKDFFPTANGNWDAAMMDTMLCIGVFCDDHAMFDRAIEHFQRGSGNGGITKYIYPSGQCQETTRDQSHTQLGLGELALACQVAWNQGVDLYGAAGNRLALGFEYTAEYLLGQEVPAFGTISPRGRDRFSDIYESVYQHYHCLNALALPWTAKAVERTRAKSIWGALIFCKGPDSGAVGSPLAPPGGHLASVLAERAAGAPSGTVCLTPGQSIQGALDGCSRNGGGWVLLSNGVHALPAPLRLPSGVTLAGQGRATILLLDPKATADRAGAALTSAEPDLHDVTIRDLVIEGATSSNTSTDPNADRHRRARTGAPSRAGVVFTASSPRRMRGLCFEQVTVRNCTQNGVTIRGASRVAISGCYFSDNGSVAVPSAQARHNLVLQDVEGCDIKHSRFDTSPGGCGLAFDQSRAIDISNNEFARNALFGVWLTRSQNIRILRNLAEGNDAGGFFLGAPAKGPQEIEVRRNLIRNNGGCGVEISSTIQAVISGNKLMDNACAEQLRVASSERISRQ